MGYKYCNYNNSKYVEQCLTSVINQNYKKVEIIVVDDNSTDNSLEIIIDNKKLLISKKI